MSCTDKTIPLHTLVYYRSLLREPVIKNFMQMTQDTAAAEGAYFALKADLLDWAMTRDAGTAYAPTPWKDFILTQILRTENTLNFLFERSELAPDHPFYPSIRREFGCLCALYAFDWAAFLKARDLDREDVFALPVFTPGDAHQAVADAFDTGDADRALKAVNHYIAACGLGIFETHASFKLNAAGRLLPITQHLYKPMDSLIGYAHQKQELTANTAAFIKNYTGLNVLLQGDMGTGKSTMVKSLLTTFKDTRLKMIEIKKDQLSFIPAIIQIVKNRPYPFILFIDDLSFEEHDEDYKIFKNVLEGSLDENPKNLLIYATSNKRHLVTETRTERENAVHTKDVMEEKLSLSSRFGLVLTFTVPDQKNYLSIVDALAREAGLDLPEDTLRSEAIKWEMRHLNRSGRTAEQFINYLKVSAAATAE